MGTILVKAAHPRAIFTQSVIGDGGEVLQEMVFAPTDASGRQVPQPMEITDTAEARRALNEFYPAVPGQADRGRARIVECSRDEEKAFYAARETVVTPSEPESSTPDETAKTTPTARTTKGN